MHAGLRYYSFNVFQLYVYAENVPGVLSAQRTQRTQHISNILNVRDVILIIIIIPFGEIDVAGNIHRR